MAGLQIRNVGIIGGGAWGLTLANLLSDNGLNVLVWDRNPQRVEMLKEHHSDPQRLPGIVLNKSINFTNNLAELSGLDIHIFAVKSEAVEEMTEKLKDLDIKILVSAIKGFVGNGIKTITEHLKENLKGVEIFALGGPSIALEVCKKIPTSVVLAGENESIMEEIQKRFSNGYFRVYRNPDIVGVEFAGALKNIIAIAAGICDGLGLGENSKGALLTRGIYEMARFGIKFGARMETFFGLAGLGDVITTSFSKNSRNRYVGEMLGKGYTIEEILKGMVMVAEGVRTAFLVRGEADKLGIEMPITEGVCRVIEGKNKPNEIIYELMTRELKREFYV